jgi:hypothetical protein
MADPDPSGNSDNETDIHHRGANQPPPDATILISLKQAVPNAVYTAPTPQEHPRDFYDKAHITLLALTFIAAFAAAVFTGLLWISTRDLVTSADQASARQLRPYVWAQVNARLYGDDSTKLPDRYALGLLVKNTGKTWARNVRIRHKNVASPSNDPFDAAELEKIDTGPIVLGPGEDTTFQLNEIYLDELRQIAPPDGHDAIFLTAWITYDDGMTNPPTKRQTQLSVRLNADTRGIGHVSFTHMPTHNCVDSDCPQ